MLSEKALKQAEMDQLKGIGAEEMEMKYGQLNKMKQLLFRQEIKNKRIKKIKSKLYHKLKKKEKVREEGKLRAYLEEVDPEAAMELEKKEELKKAEERLRLRHSGNKKWAKDMRRFKGKMDNREMREQYHDMMREKNALKDRQAGIKRKAGVEEESDDESESDSDLSKSELKARAIRKIKEQVSDEDSDGEASDNSSDESGDGVVKQDFD